MAAEHAAKAQFSEEVVEDWAALVARRADFDEAWLFRGQPSPWPLVTSLERACALFDVPASAMAAVEQQMITDFQRRYTGRHRKLLLSDTLYCMAVMQHHGAPTRLLDFTYSFYVGVYFALEPFGKEPTLWCLNGRWCRDQSIRIAGAELIGARERERNEHSFRQLYLSDPPHRLVFPENPFPLHRRLIIQQGVFACPADVTAPFLANLEMGTPPGQALVKLRLQFDKAECSNALRELGRMNIDRASLFPGLDGFAQSLKLRIPLYQRIAIAWAEDERRGIELGPRRGSA